MKVFSVTGISKSGKTTTIENIIRELKARRYSIGSIKEIHYEDFAIDQEGTNTYRHHEAGAEVVTARGYHETDILFPDKLPIEEILRFYYQDYVVMEGVTDYNLPKIICAAKVEDLENSFDRSVFAVSGPVAEKIKEYKKVPVIDAVSQARRLVDLIESRVYEMLPDFPTECCSECGYGCREFGYRILEGKSKRSDCIISDSNVKLLIDGREIEMVPFVQDLVRGSVEGVIKNLKGYRKGKTIEVKIG